MQKIKIISWALLICFLGLVFYQNQAYFLETHALNIDLLIAQYITWQIPNIMFIIGSFIAGFLICFFFSLLVRFNATRTIRELNMEIEHLKAGSKSATETESIVPGSDSASEALSDANSSDEATASHQDKGRDDSFRSE
jgi:uncharacterized integral membrane protein